MITKQQHQRISKLKGIVGCSWYSAVSTYQKCSCWPLMLMLLMLMLFTVESTYYKHVSIRNGPWWNRSRWRGLMNHIFFCVHHLPGQEVAPDCLLGFSIHVDVTDTTIYLNIIVDQYTPLCQEYFLMASSGLFPQNNAPFHTAKKSSGMVLGAWLGVAPDLNTIFVAFQDLLLMSLYQIPQHTIRGFVESRLWQVRAVLAAQILYIRGHTQY